MGSEDPVPRTTPEQSSDSAVASLVDVGYRQSLEEAAGPGATDAILLEAGEETAAALAAIVSVRRALDAPADGRLTETEFTGVMNWGLRLRTGEVEWKTAGLGGLAVLLVPPPATPWDQATQALLRALASHTVDRCPDKPTIARELEEQCYMKTMRETTAAGAERRWRRALRGRRR